MGQFRSDMVHITEEQKIDLMKRTIKILNKHKIKYWLVFGTLLGCVRENCFIPWDSDIDLAVEDVEPVYALKDEFAKNDITVERKNFKGHSKAVNLLDDLISRETSMHVDLFEFRRFKGHLAYKWTIQKNIISRGANTVFHLCCREHVVKGGILTVDQMKTLYKYFNKIPNGIRSKIGNIFEDLDYFFSCKRIMVFPETEPQLKKVKFYDMKVNIPITCEAHLKTNYGENWMTPDKNFSGKYTHKIFKKIGGYEIVTSLLSLRHTETNWCPKCKRMMVITEDGWFCRKCNLQVKRDDYA